MNLQNRIRGFLNNQVASQVEDIFGGALTASGKIAPVFKEQPVSFATFIESSEHMAFPALSERQLDVGRFMLGNTSQSTFDNENTIAVLLWGKGAGKDTLAALIILYLVYYLLCLRDPQKFFGLPSGEPIDLLNVAYSADQAQAVFFEKFRQRIIRWKWLKAQYKIKMSGVYLKQIKEDTVLDDTVNIIRDGIIFPHLIRAFSGHSQQESLEGRNLLAWVMDEACFKSTQGITLADGSRKQIREIVNKKLPVEVLSYNFETKKTEPKKVTNWFKYPYKGEMLELKFNDRKYKSSKFFRCTPNHHIYTPSGVRQARDLTVGDTVHARGRFLSDDQRQILYGTLLGDSSLSKGKGRGNSSPQLMFGHGEKQLGYLNWKIKAFQSLVHREPKGYPGGYQPKNLCYTINLSYFDGVDDVYSLTHSGPDPYKKHTSKAWLEKLNHLGLAIWYLDDGSLSYNPSKHPTPRVSFCIADRTPEEAKIIQQVFQEKFGYNCFLNPGQRDDKQGYTLYLLKDSSKQFLQDVAPYIPKCMQYKSIQPATFVQEDTSTDFLPMAVTHKRSYRVPHSFVYDFEVEDNHNYFAGDMLVSNSAFKDKTQTHNADKIFNVLNSSATSRFGTRFKGFILSYPRYKGDFTMRMHDMAEGELHWYSDRGFSWEIKPARFYSGKTFEFEGHRVPKEFEKEFKRDPTEAKCKYMAIPPEVEQAFIEYPEKIDACIDYHRQPLITFRDYHDDGFVKKSIESLSVVPHTTEFIVTIDLGLKSDAAALSIFRYEREDGRLRFIQEAVTSWKPNKDKKLLVSFTNIEKVLSEVRRSITITGVYFDQWQSATLIQQLNESQLASYEYKLTFEDYKTCKERLYNGEVRLLPHPDQISELKQLVLVNGKKVDHTSDGSKDLADTIVGAVKLFSSGKRTDGKGGYANGGEFISENLGSEGSFV